MGIRLGITGHRGFGQDTTELIATALRETIEAVDVVESVEASPTTEPESLIGITCLAEGADALFAHLILERGGAIEVIVPAADYRDRLPYPYRSVYDGLISQARAVHRLDHIRSDAEAYMAASRLMLADVDELIAVWDGLPAISYGGTADVVAEAIDLGIPVRILWPEGAKRD